MRQKKTLIAIAVFFTICLALYAYLGGLEEIAISYEPVEELHIIGKPYEGDLDGSEMKNIFLEFKSLVEKDTMNGTLVILYYRDAQQGNDTISCFTGILTDHKPENLPFGMEHRLFETNGIVRARFDGHRLVTPNPASIKKKAAKYVEEHHLTMQDLFLEKYFSNSAIEVDYLLY